MKTALVLGLMAIQAHDTLASKVVPMRFEKIKNRQAATSDRLDARDSPFAVDLLKSSQGLAYVLNASLGTPPQTVQVQLDTGSTSFWVPAPNSGCQGGCSYGTFASSQSSTYKAIDQGGLNITYGKGHAIGNTFTDQLSIGDIKLNDLTMGVATETDEQFGILGVSGLKNALFDPVDGEHGPVYPTFMYELANQGFIQSPVYSIFLDDISATTGTVLFGGIDKAKFKGDLIGLPSQTTTGGFNVTWTNFTITNEGKVHQAVPDDYINQALLDSGTSFAVLPSGFVNELVAEFNATFDKGSSFYLTTCDYGNTDATLDFQFGGSAGPLIHVPFREFLSPYIGDNGPATTPAGKPICILGIEEGDQVILGDVFLRSAYTVFDLANGEIAMAQASYDSKGSQIVEVGANGISNLVNSVATPASAETDGGSSPSASSFQFQTFAVTPTASYATTATGAAATGGHSGKNAAAATAAPHLIASLLPFVATVLFCFAGIVVL